MTRQCLSRRIADIDETGKPGRPSKDNRTMLNGMVWIARSGAPWRDLPERYGPWNSVYSRFRKWIDDGILDNIFWVLSLEAELYELSLDATIVQAHQHSAGAVNYIKVSPLLNQLRVQAGFRPHWRQVVLL